MASHSIDLAIVVALVAVAGVLMYGALRRALQRAVALQQEQTERRLNALSATIKSLESRLALAAEPVAAQPATVAEIEPPAFAQASEAAVQNEREEVTPEILAVIAAAASAFLGSEVRIRSASLMQSPIKNVSPWSQQGRVFVQASHNLR